VGAVGDTLLFEKLFALRSYPGGADGALANILKLVVHIGQMFPVSEGH
jgi:hypothetical protein